MKLQKLQKTVNNIKAQRLVTHPTYLASLTMEPWAHVPLALDFGGK